jgi:hypothetical protein
MPKTAAIWCVVLVPALFAMVRCKKYQLTWIPHLEEWVKIPEASRLRSSELFRRNQTRFKNIQPRHLWLMCLTFLKQKIMGLYVQAVPRSILQEPEELAVKLASRVIDRLSGLKDEILNPQTTSYISSPEDVSLSTRSESPSTLTSVQAEKIPFVLIHGAIQGG